METCLLLRAHTQFCSVQFRSVHFSLPFWFSIHFFFIYERKTPCVPRTPYRYNKGLIITQFTVCLYNVTHNMINRLLFIRHSLFSISDARSVDVGCTLQANRLFGSTYLADTVNVVKHRKFIHSTLREQSKKCFFSIHYSAFMYYLP